MGAGFSMCVQAGSRQLTRLEEYVQKIFDHSGFPFNNQVESGYPLLILAGNLERDVKNGTCTVGSFDSNSWPSRCRESDPKA
jgi:hypothetical protein